MVYLSILVLTLDNFVGSECLVLTHSHTGSFAQNSFQTDLIMLKPIKVHLRFISYCKVAPQMKILMKKCETNNNIAPQEPSWMSKVISFQGFGAPFFSQNYIILKDPKWIFNDF